MVSETSFFSLPHRTRKKIDSAFNSVAKKDKAYQGPIAAGGFIVESGGFVRDNESEGGFLLESGPDDVPVGGGFLLDDDEQPALSESTHIPLSSIPAALQYLDLAPDDEDVLAVFRNAATGWTTPSNQPKTSLSEDQFVSREDWRSVCTVLLEDDSRERGTFDEDVEMVDPEVDSDDDADSEEYRESEIDGEEVDLGDDDDFIDLPVTRRRTRKSMPMSSSSSSPSMSLDPQSRKPSSRQRQACVDAYALLFPTTSPDELLNQRIMIKDIQRVAKLLNEKLKTEEMMDMLETFSTSPDKSMNFDDFCRMMIRAKLA